ncbi:MAG: enoyl-CoA hydratase/isomerase family protein [Alicyclobacillus macrosporangiidus]|uniref:enoyl-CoA hydratase-related protein n=1 Tax=Alicyclobacillus macrosporangiidus TaxID=392015 RepID=UPI0026F0F1FD|nr:enoyl-CoA hydratase-related protein [Alicyclobacillus macrosporangiidus]MCL6599913.1 enoyl-CoA hydratase/isomerase family protein [Alicyclobacillus macrosporangiidus]
MYETIRFEERGSVGVIALNRPDRLNAITPQMLEELRDAFGRVQQRDEVRAVILTGEGRAFCAGQDLRLVEEHPNADYRGLVESGYNPLVEAITSLEKPVVAVVNGVAAGAGASLALACDLRLASDRASFVQAFVHIGLVPDSGATWFLPRLVGLTKALELAMLGETVSAEEALRIGLVYRVVPHDELAAQAEQLAERLAALPTRAIGYTKRALYQAMHASLRDQLTLEAELQQLAGQTEDHREGVRAFLEKRKPVFHGR